MVDTFVFDTPALCGFAAHIAVATGNELGLEVTEEHWPAIADAVRSFVDAQLDRIAFAAQTQADLAALPTTE